MRNAYVPNAAAPDALRKAADVGVNVFVPVYVVIGPRELEARLAAYRGRQVAQ